MNGWKDDEGYWFEVARVKYGPYETEDEAQHAASLLLRLNEALHRG